MSGRIDWSDFWAMFPGLEQKNPDAITEIARALNQAGNFAEWVNTRSDRVKAEIFTGAPEWIRSVFLKPNRR